MTPSIGSTDKDFTFINTCAKSGEAVSHLRKIGRSGFSFPLLRPPSPCGSVREQSDQRAFGGRGTPEQTAQCGVKRQNLLGFAFP